MASILTRTENFVDSRFSVRTWLKGGVQTKIFRYLGQRERVPQVFRISIQRRPPGLYTNRNTFSQMTPKICS